MTPDELRALAGKLRKLQAGEAYEAADYLRACADAQPVAYKHTESGGSCVAYYDADESPCESCIPLYTHPAPAVPAGWQLVPVEPTPEMLQAGASIMDFDRSGWYDADVSRAEYRAMLAAAPTVPQAEPIDPHMIVADDRFPDEQAEPKRELTADERDMMDSALRSSVKVVARGVAEPKREPLSDERIAEIQRAAYERAAQACEAQISGSDHHYLATHGHWDHMAQAATNCAAAIRALGRQHD